MEKLTQVIHQVTTGSTNTDARVAFESGLQNDPCWYTADRQTSGVGRRGRSWSDFEENFAGTLLWPVTESETQWPALFSFLPALAVFDTLVHCKIPADDITLKWPNDVLVRGDKICGILPELLSFHERQAVIIGIGVNLASHPELEDYSAISISAAMGTVLPPSVYGRLLDRYFRARWSQFREGGFDPIREAWFAKAHGVGQNMVAKLAEETIEGQFAGLGSSGELLLTTEAGTRTILAADVYLKPLKSQGKE